MNVWLQPTRAGALGDISYCPRGSVDKYILYSATSEQVVNFFWLRYFDMMLSKTSDWILRLGMWPCRRKAKVQVTSIHRFEIHIFNKYKSWRAIKHSWTRAVLWRIRETRKIQIPINHYRNPVIINRGPGYEVAISSQNFAVSNLLSQWSQWRKSITRRLRVTWQ